FRFAGPHDSYGEDIIVTDASQETNDTYSGFFLEGNGSGRWINCHAWHRSTATNRMEAAGRIETSSNEFIACHFEGGRQCLINRGNRNTYKGCYAFATFGTDPMVVLRGVHVFFEARIEDSLSAGASCLQIGEAGGGNDLFYAHLDVMCITAVTNAVVV